MFGKSIRLFKMFGFTVSMDWSWLILAALIIWSLAVGFAMTLPGMAAEVYWAMGVLGALALFFSIVVHELCHSLVARRYGMPMKGITLFIFGGVAEMNDEPKAPSHEFLMAIAGPAASVAITAVGIGGWLLAGAFSAPAVISELLAFIWRINLILAIFNMVPAFPLDGGRVFRSMLWGWKKDLRWATRVASQFGSAFGMFLIILGVFVMIATRAVLSGVWFLLIGWFVRSAARQSYQQLLMRQALEGEHIDRFMNDHPVTVSPNITLQQLVDYYVYPHGHAMYPVVSDDTGELLGSISVQQVKQLPREQWSQHLVSEFMRPCTPENTVNPNTDAVHLLAQMQSSGQSRVMVAQDHKLLGVITLKDLLKFLALKVELEEGPAQPPGIRLAGRRDDDDISKAA